VSATAPNPGRRDRLSWHSWVRGTGELLVTAGVIILLFVVYELWWTGLTTRHDQHQALAQLAREWARPLATQAPIPPYGSGLAILFIPRLGRHYKYAIIQGTSTADLIKGPGHYPGTALPGQIGNFAVAGHRTTYLHPFYDIDKLKPGDAIVVETRQSWFTYRVQNVPRTHAKYQEIVSPTDVAVAYPVPDQADPSKVPTQRVLTFTSCNPRYSAAQRIVVHGVLASVQPRLLGPPAALTSKT
jgi:sortase A